MSTLPIIDFSQIRLHRKSRNNGFEELCYQLFKSDFPPSNEVVRVEGVGGDGGVEAYNELNEKGTIGLQAKFFEKIGTKQWEQITKSVKATIKNHPQLCEYRIATPINKNPTQNKKWNSLVKEWKALTPDKDIDFIWWGESQLTEFLIEQRHRDKLRYWFGLYSYSEEWLQSINKASIQTLDMRYTPEHHIKTESESTVEAFWLSPDFKENYKTSAAELLRSFRDISIPEEALENKDLTGAWSACRDEWKKFVTEIGSGETISKLYSLSQKLAPATEQLSEISSKLSELSKEAKKKKEQTPAHWDPFSYCRHQVEKCLNSLYSFKDFLTKFGCADKQFLLVQGAAGTGKSHLLARAISDVQNEGGIGLLLLGEFFTAKNNPWVQVEQITHWNHGIDTLLASINHAAEIHESFALICIDALNESDFRNLWKKHLLSFAEKLTRFSNIKLIVSCRSDFSQIALPGQLTNMQNSLWATIIHYGFGSQMFNAVIEYFKGYNIQSDHFPPLLGEFENPLFLKTVCEAFEDSQLQANSLTLKNIMDKRISKLTEKLLEEIDCPEYITQKAIDLIVEEISKAQNNKLPFEKIRPQIDQMFPGQGESKSLYTHLRSNGFIVEVGSWKDEKIYVRLQFERFADYLIVQKIIGNSKSYPNLEKKWKKSGFWNNFADSDYMFENRNIISMLAIMLPEKFNIELANIIQGDKCDEYTLSHFMESIPWRSPSSFTPKSTKLIKSVLNELPEVDWMRTLFGISAIPQHPFNADFLHTALSKQTLRNRELLWTIPITQDSMWDDQAAATTFVSWALAVEPRNVPDNQAILVAKLLSWFFTSTAKKLRNRATMAVVRILNRRCHLVEELIADFSDCNDPYVTERVYAVAAGVAMREIDAARIKRLAKVVFEHIFAEAEITPHILLRDYAACVLEKAHSLGCLPSGINPEMFRPPYKSTWPMIWDERRTRRWEKKDEFHTIANSIRPAAMGYYGDWGRYEMQSNLHSFQNIELTKPPSPDYSNWFDSKTARRWVMQRIVELGWKSKIFKGFESNLPYVSRYERPVERISKKYQWIALYELLGYLSDHYHLSNRWQEKSRKFEGAYQTSARTFDPSTPFPEPLDVTLEPQKHIQFWNVYPCPFTSMKSHSETIKWVEQPDICDFKPLLEVSPTPEKTTTYLSLSGWYDFDEKLPLGISMKDRGQRNMWIHVRSWLVHKNNAKKFIKSISKLNFWGNGLHLPRFDEQWIGEYPWGAGFSDLINECKGGGSFLGLRRAPVFNTCCVYSGENDCETVVASPFVIPLVNSRWSGKNFDFVDARNNTIITTPHVKGSYGKTPCLIEKNALVESLDNGDLEIVWTVVAERSCFDGQKHVTNSESQYSGVYYLKNGTVKGCITKHVIERFGEIGTD